MRFGDVSWPLWVSGHDQTWNVSCGQAWGFGWGSTPVELM